MNEFMNHLSVVIEIEIISLRSLSLFQCLVNMFNIWISTLKTGTHINWRFILCQVLYINHCTYPSQGLCEVIIFIPTAEVKHLTNMPLTNGRAETGTHTCFFLSCFFQHRILSSLSHLCTFSWHFVSEILFFSILNINSKVQTVITISVSFNTSWTEKKFKTHVRNCLLWKVTLKDGHLHYDDPFYTIFLISSL